MKITREKIVQRKKLALFFSVFFIWFAFALSPVLVGLNDVGSVGVATQEAFAQQNHGCAPDEIAYPMPDGGYDCRPATGNVELDKSPGTSDVAAANDGFWAGIGNSILNAIGSAIISTGALITYAGGSLFEKAVEIFVVGFGTLIAGGSLGGGASSNLGGVINTIWTLVRDVSNLIFIFGFLYIGILLIYNADSSTARKSLAGLIVAALLVNFSLFITKFVIEFFNLLSYVIYSKMTNGGTTEITAAIMNILGLPTLYGPPSTSFLATMTGGGTFWFFIMAFVFMIMAAFVFFSGALMLLVRFVALLFIMMFSPILFAATVFPQTASYAKKMWRYLFDYSIFAPAYLFLLFVAISVLAGLNLSGSTGFDTLVTSLDSPGGSRPDAYMVVLNFVVAIIVIQYAGSLAKKMGLAGGDLAISIADRGKKVIRGMAGGGARKLIGGSSNYLQKKFDRTDAQNGGVVRALRATGLDRAVRNTFESGKKAKFGTSTSYADVQTYNKESRARRAQLKPVMDLEDAMKMDASTPAAADARRAKIEELVTQMTRGQLEEAGFKVINDPDVMRYLSSNMFSELQKSDKFDDAQKQKFNDTRQKVVEDIFMESGRVLTREFGNASIAQLEALGENFLKNNAHSLTDSQISALEKSKVYTESQVNAIKAERKTKLQSYMSTSYGTKQVFENYVGGTMGYEKKSPKEIAKLPRAVLMDINALPHMSAAVLEAIYDNKSLGPADRAALKASIEAPGSAAPSDARNYLKSPAGKLAWDT